MALLCFTSKLDCCEEQLRQLGEWYFPNGSAVGRQGVGNFYRSRGPSVVRLHHRKNAMVPTGVFHCEIPDANETIKSIYVGVYPDHQGVGIILYETIRHY